ncbi:MAG: hypothetical protein HYX75_24615 [Acidobacteria bacterium]|nr:hypothetical protein [Acidobacteriota bacterium]
MRKMCVSLHLALAGMFLWGAASYADPLPREKVPEPLAPWVSWVLSGHEGELCPYLLGATDQARCAWPGSLSLQLEDKGAEFTQEWKVFAETWVPLAGDAKRCWPQGVRVDGAPAAVIMAGGGPGVRLSVGSHTISGAFEWDSPPELLQVPPETGLLSLSVRGKHVDFPNRDEQGRLWLQRARAAEEGVVRLDVAVHRRVIDEIPLQLITRIELKVSGKNREEVLGPALPSHFVPMSITGPLPCRIEPDGGLRVQVRPGTWNIELVARHDGPATTLTAPSPRGQWDSDEVWVFDARNDLRIVAVEGVSSIDPQQTQLPGDWQSLPAYLMRPNDAMQLVERRRGDADPAPDRLSLNRTLWLDFDGGGFTVRDMISGTLSRSWRLEMAPGTKLGRAGVAGQDQFITELTKGGEAGIEVRQGQLSMDADSRIESGVRSIPAVGWNHDFESVSGRLHLPPGWRLIHATGVDRASPSWITAWSLLDFFLVLIIGLSIGKLFDPTWGALALATAALTWHEPFAPRWIWLFVLAGEALSRVLPEGVFLRTVRVYRLVVRSILVLIAIPFLILQARQALYPQLEAPWTGVGFDIFGTGRYAAAPPPQTVNAPMLETAPSPEEEVQQEAKARVPVELGYAPSRKSAVISQMNAPDPNARVSTGPGLPSWSWSDVEMTWRGPVGASQKMHLFLLSPAMSFLLSALRIVLICLLVLCVFGISVGPHAERILKRFRGPGSAIGAALLILVLCSSARADNPSPEMLQELQKRLLAKPDCLPNCAQSPRMKIEVTPSTLRARIDIDAATETGVPLPGGAQQWSPARVLIDERPARGLLRTSDGILWIPVSAGTHQIILEGSLPDRETVMIPLPLKPHRVEADVSGWILDGLHEDGLAEDTLQLTRVRGAGGRSEMLEQEALPPFVRVERELLLGLAWQVQTRVMRLTPLGSAIVLDVPLIAGESVTSADVRVTDGKATVTLSPQLEAVQWTSVLQNTPEITLTAPPAVSWVEVWRLNVNPIWHAEPAGIPAIHAADSAEMRVREWRPWPGESITIGISRPGGVAGQTLTIDHNQIIVTPGLRATDATLEIRLRSSRGGVHAMTLPEEAELQSVSIDSTTQPIRQEGRRVTIPVSPGQHVAQLTWRQPGGMTLRTRTPEIDLGLTSVNSDIVLSMPADRWTLLLNGPPLGPAVLFWSVLVVLLLVCVGLGRLHLTPLRTLHWFLLSLGLTQASIVVAAIIVVWLLALGWRKHRPDAGQLAFNFGQIGLALLTIVALACLVGSITQGLLGLPDMQIDGNGSSASELRWYQDRSPEKLPIAWVVSVPLMVYRGVMLAWALWIALSLINWLKWGWACFTEGGYWRSREPRKDLPPPPAPPPPLPAA